MIFFKVGINWNFYWILVWLKIKKKYKDGESYQCETY